MDSHPRQMNLQGLLRFAMEHTKSEDAKGTSTFEQMDPEKKQFLEAALKAMTVDVIEEFEKAIKALENPNASTLEKKNAFELIREYIDNIDFANNFIKVGGAEVLFKYLEHENSQLKEDALNVMAEMAQNNPFCQKFFIDAKIMPKLLEYFDSKHEEVANAAIYTVSSIVRSYEPALVEFINNDGIVKLLHCLKSPHCRVFIKACFLIANLCREFAVVRDEIVKKIEPHQIANQLEVISGFDIKMETLLFALSELTKSNAWNPSKEENETICEILQQTIDQNQALPECDEIINYAKEILDNLKKV